MLRWLWLRGLSRVDGQGVALLLRRRGVRLRRHGLWAVWPGLLLVVWTWLLSIVLLCLLHVCLLLLILVRWLLLAVACRGQPSVSLRRSHARVQPCC